MNTQKQLKQVTDSANELLATIEDECWDEALELSQQWDANIRRFFRDLSAEEFIEMKSDIENIASKNTSIKNQLIELRAKVLTQIQDNKHSHTAIQLYSNTF